MVLIIDNNVARANKIVAYLKSKNIYSMTYRYDTVIKVLKERFAVKRKRDFTDYYINLLNENKKIEVRFPRYTIIAPNENTKEQDTLCELMERTGTSTFRIAFCFERSNAKIISYADKKYNLEFCVESAAQALENENDFSSPELRVGRIFIDDRERKLYPYGEEVFLTKCEYRILRFLMHNPDEKFPKSLIYDYCFSKEEKKKLSNIVTHISNINKKAVCACGKRLIRNKSKDGYYIVK